MQINHSDTIEFYESLSGKKDLFPSMVGKIKEIEKQTMVKFKENFVLVDESKNRDDDIQGDSDAFNLKFSPRTKRRIKRNLQLSS